MRNPSSVLGERVPRTWKLVSVEQPVSRRIRRDGMLNFPPVFDFINCTLKRGTAHSLYVQGTGRSAYLWHLIVYHHITTDCVECLLGTNFCVYVILNLQISYF